MFIISREKIWLDTIDIANKKQLITTTRGEAAAIYRRTEGETIYLEFMYQGQLKEAKIRKSDIYQVLDVISLKGKVRQSNLSNKDKRYVLGIMKELPYFEVVKQHAPDKNKPVPFLIWRVDTDLEGV